MREKRIYLVMSRGVPIGKSGWICDGFLQAMGSECAERDGAGAVEAANCPKWNWHCEVGENVIVRW